MLRSFRQSLANFLSPAGSSRVIYRGSHPPRGGQDYWRSFDGASGRRGKFGTFNNIVSEVSAAGPVLRRRARYLAANNQWLSNGVNNWVGALVGSGIRPTSKSASAVEGFDSWAENADADGLTDFYGLQALIARALVVDGESFVQCLHDESGFKLRVIPAELVDESLTRDLGNGRVVVQGVEFDAAGKRVAYHVLPQRLDQFASYAPPVRVDVADILHIFKPLMPGQVRGVSWLAPVILSANELDQLADALLVGVKVAAMMCGVITDQNNMSPTQFDGQTQGNILEGGLEPATLKRLNSGEDIKFTSPPVAQQTNEFVKHNLRGLAAGLGLPSHLLDGDLSNANYSSLRASLLPFRQRVEQIQYHTLVPQLLAPVWRRAMLLDGEPGARAEWIMPASLQVDPEKAVKADLLEINAGLKSRRQAIAERGWSAEQLDAEIAQDREREAALGLTFGAKEESTPQPKEELPDV